MTNDVILDINISQTATPEYTDAFETVTEEGDAASVALVIDLDSEVGTASLTITPQVSIDKSNWIDRAAFPALTATGQTEGRISSPLRYMRFKLELAGSSSPAFVGTIKATPSSKQQESATGILTGQGSIAAGGTGQQLSSSSVKVQSVVIIADDANAGALYVGDSTVETNTGAKIPAGKSLAFPIDYLTRIYLDGTTGDDYSYLAIKA